jgi:hypothetical protein
MDAAVQLQASIRQSAQEQADAFNAVNSWFSEIRDKEQTIQQKRSRAKVC